MCVWAYDIDGGTGRGFFHSTAKWQALILFTCFYHPRPPATKASSIEFETIHDLDREFDRVQLRLEVRGQLSRRGPKPRVVPVAFVHGREDRPYRDRGILHFRRHLRLPALQLRARDPHLLLFGDSIDVVVVLRCVRFIFGERGKIE